MRRWLAILTLFAACSDDQLPGFATGAPSYGDDAAADHPLDASTPLDASLDAAPSDAALTDR